MKTRFLVLILLAATIDTLAIGAAAAQTRVPGVSAGMEFTYSQSSLWLSSDANLPQPAGLADVNMTDYYRVTITQVSVSNVSTHVRWHFKNGTDLEKDGSVSLETTSYQGEFWAVIGSNLNAGDRVHPNSEQDLSTINETVGWSYGSYQRLVNHLSLVFANEKSDFPNSTYTENVDTYFDRQTGALVQLEDMHTNSNPLTTLTVTWRLTSQTAWAGPDTPENSTLPIVIAGVVVLILVSSVLLLYRKRIFVHKR